MENVLKTYNLTKKFRDVYGTVDLNMTINKGDIYGFLGQNGAGKTTTIAMVMGLVKPSSGEFELFGQSMSKENKKVYSRIGSLIEYAGFYYNLTARENLEIHRRMMSVHDKKSIKQNLKLVGLSEVENKKVGEFSLGMKQRLGIARALLHKPEFIVLDEPINGLDPIGIKEIRELIISLRNEKEITFLISSHILSEIHNIATKIGIIHKGELLEEFDFEELKNKSRNFVQIKVNDDKKAVFLIEQKLKILDYSIYEKNVIRIYKDIDKSAYINKVLVQNDVDVIELVVNCDSLEDYFIRLTGGVEND